MFSAHLIEKKCHVPLVPHPVEARVQETHLTDGQRPCAHSAHHNELGSFLDGKHEVGRLELHASPLHLPLVRRSTHWQGCPRSKADSLPPEPAALGPGVPEWGR